MQSQPESAHAVFTGGLRDVTRAAKCLESVRIERVLPRLALHRRDVIALQASGLAHITQR